MKNSKLVTRIGAWLDGRISEAESEALQQELRDSAEARATFNRYSELDAAIREVADTEGVGAVFQTSGSSVVTPKRATSYYVKSSLAIAALIIVAFTAVLYVEDVKTGTNIVRIKGLNGALTWIGNGGEVVQGAGSTQTETRWSNVLSEGAELPGGTIEGMAPDSWFELEFHDGSTCMISGDSILTFSDQGQKELRLMRGRFSADVKPQPEGKPMLIDTPSAVLEVIGTQFEVEAKAESTTLYVREGKVQVRRVYDGRTVDVLANHRVVASADSEMLPQFVVPELTWAQTPVWRNIASSGNQDSIATQEARDYDGARNLVLSEELAILPAQDTDYIIRSGDFFEIRYEWMGGMWWAAQDQVAIRLFTTDNDLISGTPTTFATLLSGPSTTTGSYETGSGSVNVPATEARKRLFVAIDTQDGAGELHGFAHLDDFQLQVTHFPEPGAPRLDDFLLKEADFPDPPPAPTATLIIGGNVRNGDFNGE